MASKLHTYLILFLFLLFGHSASAQFLNTEIDIDSEISTALINDLDFGTLIRNSGTTRVNLGDVNMGIFRITALQNQTIVVNLSIPEKLSHENPAVSDSIPLDIKAAYNNLDNNFRSANSFSGSGARFDMGSPNNANFDQSSEIWRKAYLYIYGSLNIGDIQSGIYAGEIILSVSYE